MTAEVDFWWPSVRAIGEADGRGKYLAGTDLTATAGDARSAARRVVQEKDRENALRRRVRSLDRWDWAELARKHPIERRLTAMGIPRTRPRRALIGPPDAPSLRG